MAYALGLVVSALALFALTKLVLHPERYTRVPEGSDLKILIKHCRGDRGAAYRLVELEKTRAPEISEKKAIKRAIARIERDHER
jgi:hypothetical protein